MNNLCLFVYHAVRSVDFLISWWRILCSCVPCSEKHEANHQPAFHKVSLLFWRSFTNNNNNQGHLKSAFVDWLVCTMCRLVTTFTDWYTFTVTGTPSQWLTGTHSHDMVTSTRTHVLLQWPVHLQTMASTPSQWLAHLHNDYTFTVTSTPSQWLACLHSDWYTFTMTGTPSQWQWLVHLHNNWYTCTRTGKPSQWRYTFTVTDTPSQWLMHLHSDWYTFTMIGTWSHYPVTRCLGLCVCRVLWWNLMPTSGMQQQPSPRPFCVR